MDNRHKKCCPNCSQFYSLKFNSSHKKDNLPLFLSCGHSMCENCIKNIIKFLEPIECRVCQTDMTVNADDMTLLNQNKIKLYKLFPINVHLVGELTVDYLENPAKNETIPEEQHFINLHSIMKDQTATGECMECHKPTTKMCQKCATILCDTCFNKSHKNFIIFKNHELQLIEYKTDTNLCKIHNNKVLEYYCKDCNKSICMDCFMVGGDKSCKNHNIVSMQEVNNNFWEEINNITPTINDIFKRLTKTAVDVGHKLYSMENDTGAGSELQRIADEVEQHFSRLCSIVQKHKNEVISTITKLKYAEKESLYNARSEIFNSLKKSKQVIDSINLTSKKRELKKMNLSVLLDEAKQILETPWHLSKEEAKKNPLKVIVNDDLCGLINDYIHLEGNINSIYKLQSTSELGDIELPPVPQAPVYPPELPKDVRQTKRSQMYVEEETKPMTFHKFAPQYRSKSASNNSLSSVGSDHSIRTFNKSDQKIIHEVQPFAESQHPKQLVEGSQELVYLSHLIDPHNFYVQRACHQKLVKEMLREFRNAVSLPRPSLNHVTEGKIYLTFNKADNLWQRCRVLSINKKDANNPLFKVFCFDFGSTEVVKIEHLRLIPPARLQSPYPLAINCCLANCEPLTGVWSSDDSFLIQNIIDNKQLIIYIRRVQSTSNFTVKLECDLTTLEGGVNIARALVFHDRAKMPNPKLKYFDSPGMKERPRIYMSNDDYTLRTKEQVYITHIVSPDKFYVMKKDFQPIYEKLMEDLETEYSLNSHEGMIHLPEIDMVCAVNLERVEGAGGWARALVTGVEGRGRVRLVLLDSGRDTAAHWAALRQLRHPHHTVRALATECYLAGITPLKKKWSAGSVEVLRRAAGVPLEAHVEEVARRAVGLTLYDRNHDDPLCINREMIKHKYAVTFGLFVFNKNLDHEDQVITNKCPLDKPKPAKPKPDTIKILKRDSEIKAVDKKDLEAKDKGPLRLEVKILNYQSPSLIYVSVVHQQKTFNELFEKMQKYYSKKKCDGRSEWRVGDKCCTICLGSQTWRRANIIELDNGNAKVFYSDFACVETIPVTNLRDLTPDFASMGNAAIKCHLTGVIPAIGDEWPSITKEYLKELLDAYNRIFITKIGTFKNSSMPIEIWVYHTIQGEALEPNKSEWRCLNKMIIDQGLGIPDKSAIADEVKENTENGEDTLSFLNITGSVHEWLQLEPLPLKPIHANLEIGNSSQSSPPHENVDASNIMFISDWLPAEPLPSKEFTAMPTYIDNNGIIFLHDITQQETLDLIRKAMDARFKNPDPKAKYVRWTVGEPCVAQFYLDERFYRGRILEVNEEKLSCIVHYIDYGNDEECSFENLRKSIALHQIPVQANKCVLDRIRPIHKVWDRQTLDYIHKAIVEKQCYVEVTGETVNGITPIELKYNKLWINNHLVEFEMAQYTDGTKPIIKKFAPSGSKDVDVTETDSEPDYIIEDESSEQQSTQDSLSINSMKNKDWNQLIADEQNDDDDDQNDDDDNDQNDDGDDTQVVTFPNITVDEFYCNITIINNIKIFELNIIHDDETSVLYDKMFDEIQTESSTRPPLNGVHLNKACVALFLEDMQWYRASILQYTGSENKIKVKYVDYGNIEIISLTEAREIDQDWLKLPPASISAIFHGVKPNPDIDIQTISKAFESTFLDKGPFKAKLIEYKDNVPAVELKDVNGELVYEDLIKKKIFLKCEPDDDDELALD